MANNSIAIQIEVVRSALNRGDKTLTTTRTLTDVKEFLLVEQVILQATEEQAVSLGPVASGSAIIVFTPKKVGIRVNGNDPVQCDSMYLIVGTDVTSLAIDNNLLSPAEDVTVEVWIATQTG